MVQQFKEQRRVQRVLVKPVEWVWAVWAVVKWLRWVSVWVLVLFLLCHK